LSNAEERGYAKGEKYGERKIIDLLMQGVNPADIISKYGQ